MLNARKQLRQVATIHWDRGVFFRGICSRFSALAVGVNTYSWLLVKFLLGSLKFREDSVTASPQCPANGVRREALSPHGGAEACCDDDISRDSGSRGGQLLLFVKAQPCMCD